MKVLTEIQQKLKAPKNQFNSFGRYSYRSCEDILEALKPLLDGAILLLSDEIVAVGNRYYVKATATLSKDGETATVTAFAREEETKKGMDAAQITGACSSYARKYALNGLFLIDDTKDADATNTNGKAAPQTHVPDSPALITESQKKAINSLLDSLALPLDGLEEWLVEKGKLEKPDINTMTKEEAGKMIASWDKISGAITVFCMNGRR